MSCERNELWKRRKNGLKTKHKANILHEEMIKILRRIEERKKEETKEEQKKRKRKKETPELCDLFSPQIDTSASEITHL